MDKIISGLFLIAILLCAEIVIRANSQGNMIMCVLFVFAFITMVMAGIFWKIGKGG